MKVWPKNDEMRKVLRHPSGNIAFPIEGPADWPDDTFTGRRIADGDVTTEEPEAPKAAVTEQPKMAEEAKAASTPPKKPSV